MFTPGIGPATDGAVGLALFAPSHPARQIVAKRAVTALPRVKLIMREFLNPLISAITARYFTPFR
jgi:hypothetical protein